MKSINIIAAVLLLLGLLCTPGMAFPGEVIGSIVNVVDGDTQDVLVTAGIPGFPQAGETIRIRLADIDCAELGTLNGEAAKLFAMRWLVGNVTNIDLDNTTGKDSYGRWVAVLYLADSNGSMNLNFNRILVDTGHAAIWDFSNNEFSPADWWEGTIPQTAEVKGDTTTSGTAPETATGEVRSQASTTSQPATTSTVSCAYVGNKNTKKYHRASCRYVSQISAANRVCFSSSAAARAAGYTPCKVCNP
jgi:micrococcal nuclease